MVALPIIATDGESVLAMKAHLIRGDNEQGPQEGTSRSLSEFNDRQLLTLFMKANDQLGARDLLRLQHRLLHDRSTRVDILRSSSIESLMRTRVFKPPEIAREFTTQLVAIEWNKDASQPFAFQRKNKPLDHGGRSDTLSCRVSRIDSFASAPIPVAVAIEWTALVRDNVLRGAVAFDDTTQKGANVDRPRLLKIQPMSYS